MTISMQSRSQIPHEHLPPQTFGQWLMQGQPDVTERAAEIDTVIEEWEEVENDFVSDEEARETINA